MGSTYVLKQSARFRSGSDARCLVFDDSLNAVDLSSKLMSRIGSSVSVMLPQREHVTVDSKDPPNVRSIQGSAKVSVFNTCSGPYERYKHTS